MVVSGVKIWVRLNLTASDTCAGYLLISPSLTDSDSHKSDQTEIWTLGTSPPLAAHGWMQKKCNIFYSLSWEKSPVTRLTDAPAGPMKYCKKDFTLHFNPGPLNDARRILDCFYFFKYLPMTGLKVNLFWPITLVEKSVAYNNILQTGFKLVLTVRILQTLGFHPCYVFIPDSLQAQWITFRNPKMSESNLLQQVQNNLQVLPVEINLFM